MEYYKFKEHQVDFNVFNDEELRPLLLKVGEYGVFHSSNTGILATGVIDKVKITKKRIKVWYGDYYFELKKI